MGSMLFGLISWSSHLVLVWPIIVTGVALHTDGDSHRFSWKKKFNLVDNELSCSASNRMGNVEGENGIEKDHLKWTKQNRKPISPKQRHKDIWDFQIKITQTIIGLTCRLVCPFVCFLLKFVFLFLFFVNDHWSWQVHFFFVHGTGAMNGTQTNTQKKV